MYIQAMYMHRSVIGHYSSEPSLNESCTLQVTVTYLNSNNLVTVLCTYYGTRVSASFFPASFQLRKEEESGADILVL